MYIITRVFICIHTHTLLGCRSSTRKKRRYINTTTTQNRVYIPRGVRKDKYCNNTIYVKYKKSRGVRIDGVVYKVFGKPKHTLHCLHYSRPCICGSLKHARTTHIDCQLNPRYLDVLS